MYLNDTARIAAVGAESDRLQRRIVAMRIAVSRAPGAERVVTPLELFSTSSTSSPSGSSRTTCSSTSIFARAPRR